VGFTILLVGISHFEFLKAICVLVLYAGTLYIFFLNGTNRDFGEKCFFAFASCLCACVSASSGVTVCVLRFLEQCAFCVVA
jgi:hypothetical protein